MAKTLEASAACWCPHDEDGFVRCTVTRNSGDTIWVKDRSGREVDMPAKEVFVVNPDGQDGVRDNTMLMHLQEPHMLHNLRARYGRDAIFTYTAHILIACNPFKPLDIYRREKMASYCGKSLGLMEPHVFAVADRTYRSLTHYGQSQAVIISGESGSGKTETAKIVMSYLTWSGGGERDKAAQTDTNVAQLAQRVLQANPVLESFGNARTVRNDNSSRFGKFTKILFDAKGQIQGAAISTYLLEKSRLVSHASGERGYHVFHELCTGAQKETRKALTLRDAKEFSYLVCANPESARMPSA